MDITKDTVIYDLISAHPELQEVLIECGMHCFSCPAALAETLEEACAVHGIETDEVLEAIQDFQEELAQRQS